MLQLSCLTRSSFLLAATCCLQFYSTAALPGRGQLVRLTGTVVDGNDAAIPRTRIVVTGENGTWSIISDQSGAFAIPLPPGTYTVTADVPGFHSLERAPVTLMPTTETTINLTMWPSGTTSHTTSIPPKIFYKRIPTKMRPGELVIQFRQERKGQNEIAFNPVVITCDRLTFKADKGLFFSDQNRIELEGNVVVEDGNVTTRFGRIGLDLSQEPIGIRPIRGYITVMTGEGWIEESEIYFSFDVAVPRSGRLTYRDKDKGLELVSTAIHNILTVDDTKNLITFSGLGRLNGSSYTQFTVTARHSESGTEPDMFSIEFGKYYRSGSLTQGSIRINRNR